MADLCGITIPENLNLDGVSLKNILLELQKKLDDRMIFSHRYHGGNLQPKRGAVRTQQYRYILDSNEEALYYMVIDPEQEVDLGSHIVLTVGNKSLKNTIDKAHDRASRAGELLKPWGKMELGTLKLKKGQTQLVITSSMMKGNQVLEVKGIILEKINN